MVIAQHGSDSNVASIGDGNQSINQSISYPSSHTEPDGRLTQHEKS